MKNNQGFTLVELTVYSAILGIIMTSFVSYFLAVAGARLKNNLIKDNIIASEQIKEILARDIRSADSIITPVSGSSSDILEIEKDGLVSTYSLINGKLTKEENSAAYQIHSSQVDILNLNFSHTGGSLSDTIVIDYTISSENNQLEYNFTNTYQEVATQRL